MRLHAPNITEEGTSVSLLPHRRSQTIKMWKNRLTNRTQRISAYEEALIQLHWSAQIIGMQKYCNMSTLWQSTSYVDLQLTKGG